MYEGKLEFLWEFRWLAKDYLQGLAQITPPFFYKIISVKFCNNNHVTFSVKCSNGIYKLLYPSYHPSNHTQAGGTSAGPRILEAIHQDLDLNASSSPQMPCWVPTTSSAASVTMELWLCLVWRKGVAHVKSNHFFIGQSGQGKALFWQAAEESYNLWPFRNAKTDLQTVEEKTGVRVRTSLSASRMSRSPWWEIWSTPKDQAWVHGTGEGQKGVREQWPGDGGSIYFSQIQHVIVDYCMAWFLKWNILT